jgi:predicted transposase YdaD
MPINDNAFKVMFEKRPEQFLARILPEAVLLQVLPTELPRESLYVDALLRIQYHSKVYIVHVEVQTAADATMPGRILQYIGLTWMREKIAVLPIIIYLFPASTPDTSWQMEGPDGPVVTLHYRVMKLWEEPVEEWLAAGQQAPLIFTPLLKGATIGSVGEAVTQIEQIPDPAERGNALNYLVLFAIRTFGRDTVHTYLKEHAMMNSFITESEWYQEILQRGKLEGAEEGEQRMVQRALEGRFGTVPQDILDALAGADEATLEAIVLHITTDSIEQVRERLGLTSNAPQP